MGIEEFIGNLMLEPLCYRPWEIAELTDLQILLMALAAKKRTQKTEPSNANCFDPKKADEDTKKAMFWSLGQRLGLPEEQIQLRWNNRKDPSVLKVVPREQVIPAKRVKRDVRKAIEEAKHGRRNRHSHLIDQQTERPPQEDG